MLANLSHPFDRSGSLQRDVHLVGTSRLALLSFITKELPRWRDRTDRKKETSETILTSQLCAHLNGVARHSQGWDFLQFRVEEPDETNKARKIDLVPAPCGVTIWIEGRRHSEFDPILPIECKRLPTPNATDRDEREYVFSRYSTTGGIQRFKAGVHGGAHNLGAMIAYVQEETSATWNSRVATWINELVDAGQLGWTIGDLLMVETNLGDQRVVVLRSLHTREGSLPEIELRHLWVEMT